MKKNSLCEVKQNYLERFGVSQDPFEREIPGDARFVVVIPAYREPFLIDTIQSLLACHPSPVPVHLMVLLNAPDTESIDVHALEKIKELHFPDWLTHEICIASFPKRKAGVGLARKTLMDASLRLSLAHTERILIVNLDADCLVHKRYFESTWTSALRQMSMQAFSIGFEHQHRHPEILAYELHLRYHRMLSLDAGFWHAHHTIGSAMAVWDDAYCKQGGMPPRKAGEDFYFLHKFSRIARLGHIRQVLVFPSGRPSDRVPFGTGRAVMQFQKTGGQLSYNPLVIPLLHEYLHYLTQSAEGKCITFDQLQVINKEWHTMAEGQSWIEDASQNSNLHKNYIRRIHHHFDAFRLMKYLHYLRDHGYPDIDVQKAACIFAESKNWKMGKSLEDMISVYRQKDREAYAH